MAGVTNSFFGDISDSPAPCVGGTAGSGSISSCILWLLVGVVIGSLSFSDKKRIPQ